MRRRSLLLTLVAAFGLSAAPSARRADEKLKQSPLSRSFDAIDKAGGTYGFRQLGGEKFAAAAKRAGWDERAYYDPIRLSLGNAGQKAEVRLTDADIEALAEHVAAFPRLETLELVLFNHDVTEKGLAALPPLPLLKTLRLSGRSVTSKAVSDLAELYPALETMQLTGTSVTQGGVDAVKAALPKCKVELN